MSSLIAVSMMFKLGLPFGPGDEVDDAERAAEAIVADLDEGYRTLIDVVTLAQDNSRQGGDVSAT